MSVAITADHEELASTVSTFLAKHNALREARTRLESPVNGLPSTWSAMAKLGWLSLHLPERYGGSGFGLAELAVVTEQLGSQVAPGPFAPTVIASAVINAFADEHTKQRLLPSLADGSLVIGLGIDSDIRVLGDTAAGRAVALYDGPVGMLLVPASADLVLVDPAASGVAVEIAPGLDPSRGVARIELSRAPARVIPGARQALTDFLRVVLAAEAVGVARACTDMAARYARSRIQFGRPIGTFQAVKHHCADMLVALETATAAVWDAARAAANGGQQLSFAAACAGALAATAADLCANLNTQVHGGIAITWEHDAHLYVRRAAALLALLEPGRCSTDLVDLIRAGARRPRTVVLPEGAEATRLEVRESIARIAPLPEHERRERLAVEGYVVPHWPKPFGRDAEAVEQLLIEEELERAGIERPVLGLTGWNVLTIVQSGSDEQRKRWVLPTLRGELVWCQLFSEPGAGSDASAVATKAVRVRGGWLVSGQKVWTSNAHRADLGLATIRTNGEVPKREGITVMVIDMRSAGIDIRPLRQATGEARFSEVFFDDVFVPDCDVVGPVDGGWSVARATLANESVSVGEGSPRPPVPGDALIRTFDTAPQRLDGGEARLGRYAAQLHAVGLLNLRNAHRALAARRPGPEGAVTKLVVAELWHEARAIRVALAGIDGLFSDGAGAESTYLTLSHRILAIGGGTSEIKRNQIGERILGLPRDPLAQ